MMNNVRNMKYSDIDSETRIRLELSFYRILQRHVSVREELWERYNDVCDLIDDLSGWEEYSYEYLSEDAQLVLYYLVEKFATDAGSNEVLRLFFENAAQEIMQNLKEKIENRTFYDILKDEDIDEDDEYVLQRVKKICSFSSKSTLKIVQLIVMEIDRSVRDSMVYMGAYDLGVSIKELIHAYNERVDGIKVLFDEYHIKESVLNCIKELYFCSEMPDHVKIKHEKTGARILDINL